MVGFFSVPPKDLCDARLVSVVTIITLIMLCLQIMPLSSMKSQVHLSTSSNNDTTTEDVELLNNVSEIIDVSDPDAGLPVKEWAQLELAREASVSALSKYATRREEYRLSANASLTELSPTETVMKMRKFCATRPKSMQWGPSQFLGFSAYGQHLMCVRGRKLFAEYPLSAAAASQSGHRAAPTAEQATNSSDDDATTDAAESDPSQQLPSKPSSMTMRISHGVMKWKQNRVSVPVGEFSRATFRNYSGRVVMTDALGIVSSVFLQAFHIYHNVWVPLLAVLGSQNGGAKNRAFLNRDFPQIHMLLYRELPKGALLRGGENFSAWMAAVVADGRADVTHRVDGREDESVTHCYCDGILHNMADALTMKPSQRIAEGDSLRRASALYLKRRMNHQLGFLPYGSYPVPESEYQPYGLWNDTSKGPKVPRLLFFLRRKTRTLEGSAEILQMAISAGFNVLVMFTEDHSYAVQARAARYADVILAVHGQAMVWLMMLDGVKASHCRFVIELQYFGVPLKGFNNVYEVMSADSCIRYYSIPAVAAKFFGKNCNEANHFCANWGAAMLHTNSPTTHPAFHGQSVYPSHPRLVRVLRRVFEKVSECLPKNIPVPLTYFDLSRSSAVKSEGRKKKKNKKK
ncbi:membrane-associated protein, putative [Bodo saltans]|uniref:Membrane-associated protein, putative n=1 Tax=Bodo saltans TaxID=75058 RepID=A0A0S4J9Y6_BODSA|nr:membrane-associated protein, putative [Bodo saltans]|eukprot:CUG86711.1 membrane-associated protein, putative [Bodo saltans]